MRRVPVAIVTTALVLGLAVVGCHKPASKQQCEQAARHMVRVLYAAADPGAKAKLGGYLKTLKGKSRDTIIEECVEKWSKDGAKCVLKATTKPAVRKCAFW